MSRKVPEIFPAFVYYGRPLKHMLKMIPSVSFLDHFTEEKFPPGPEEIGNRELEFKLYAFEQNVSLVYVTGQMQSEGYHPATLRSLLAFWMFNPIEIWCGRQFGFWRITALGSPQKRGGELSDEFPGINFGTLRLDNGEKLWYEKESEMRLEWACDWLFLATK